MLFSGTFSTAQETFDACALAPKLSLEGVGQPTIVIGANRFGAAFGGGVSLYFGDMLGMHTLATASRTWAQRL